MLARFAQGGAEVAALSATGEELTADLVVTEGHKHNTLASLITWRQLAAWPILGRTSFGSITVGQLITQTAAEDIGLYWFRMPRDSGGLRVTSIFYPRIRVTVPAPGAPVDSDLIVTGDLVRVGVGGLVTVVQALPPLNIFAQAGPPVVSFVNRWLTWGAVEIDPATPDALLGLRLRALVPVATHQGLVLEVAVNLRGGL
jgi:hypothetical protein